MLLGILAGDSHASSDKKFRETAKRIVRKTVAGIVIRRFAYVTA